MAHAYWHEEGMNGLGQLPTNAFSSFQGFDKDLGTSSVGQRNDLSYDVGNALGSSLRTDGSFFGQGRNPGRRSGDIGWNTGTLGGIGDIMSGVGNLGQAWAAIKNVGLARKGLEQKRQGWNANYAAQARTTNNPIRMQQAMLRSDFYADPERAKQLKLVQPATLSG
jgi:hypothetical protein